MTQTNAYLEYCKALVISLEQDLEGIASEMEKTEEGQPDFFSLDFDYNHTAGQLLVARHLLTVYGDYLYNGNLSEGVDNGPTRPSTT